MSKNGVLMFWTVALLAACANPVVVTPAQVGLTPVLPATVTPTVRPTPMLVMTATTEARFTQQCLPVDDREVALNEIALGTILVVWNEKDSSTLDSGRGVFRDLQTGNEYQLPPSSSMRSLFVTEKTSPNRKHLARLELTFAERGSPSYRPLRAVLWVLDARANIVAKMDFDRTDLVSLSWLDDERLMIETEKYGVLLLVNPFTGEQQVLANELPDIYPYKLYWDPPVRPWWSIVYSPDLEWAAYFSLQKEKDGDKERAILYNVVKKQILWTSSYGGIFPAWSPDGKFIAFTTSGTDQQLYLFSRTGQIKAVLDKSLPHMVNGFAWSPDGNLIAFRNAGRLMVYDRQKDWVFDTCILLADYIFDSDPPWSPDSRQLVVEASGDSTPMILVDWQAKTAYNNIKALPHDKGPYKWMNSQP